MENEKINLSEEDSKLAKAIHDVFRDLPKENIEYALNSTVLRDGFLETRKNLNKEIYEKSGVLHALFQEKEREVDKKNETDNDKLLEKKLKEYIPSMLDGVRKIAKVHNVTSQEVLQALEKMLDIKTGIPRINDVLTTKLLDEMSDDFNNLEKLANGVGLTTEILLKRIKEENNK